MDRHTVFEAVSSGVAFLGGIAFLRCSFNSRGRVAPHWMRVALWLTSLVAVAWSALGFTLAFYSGALSEHASFAIRNTKTLLTGMGIGILILLFASGEFLRAFSNAKATSNQ